MKRILVILFLLVGFFSNGQILTEPNTHGFKFKRFVADSLSALPSDTFRVPAALQSYPFIARKGLSLYMWNTSSFAWSQFTGGGLAAGDSTIYYPYWSNPRGYITTRDRFGLSGEDNDAGSTARSFNASLTGFTIDSITALNIRSMRTADTSTRGLEFRTTTSVPFKLYYTNAETPEGARTAGIQGLVVGNDVDVEFFANRSTTPAAIFRVATEDESLNIITDTFYVSGLASVADTTNFKPLVYETSGFNLVRKLPYWPSGGGTPTLQQVLDAGSTLTSSETISVGSNTLNLSGSGFVYNITGGAIAGQITGSGKAALLDVSSASTNSIDRPIAIRSYTSGTAVAGYGTGIQFDAERGDGNLTTVGYLDLRYTNVGASTYTSEYMIIGANNSLLDTFMNIQKSGIVRVNNHTDTLATKAYARSVAAGVQGDDIASVAGAIAVNKNAKVFEITGTNAITLISNVGWQNGSEITLIFTSTASLTDGTANSGTDIGMELAGNANFTGSADDVITLVLCEIGGTQRWREKSRSVN